MMPRNRTGRTIREIVQAIIFLVLAPVGIWAVLIVIAMIVAAMAPDQKERPNQAISGVADGLTAMSRAGSRD